MADLPDLRSITRIDRSSARPYNDDAVHLFDNVSEVVHKEGYSFLTLKGVDVLGVMSAPEFKWIMRHRHLIPPEPETEPSIGPSLTLARLNVRLSHQQTADRIGEPKAMYVAIEHGEILPTDAQLDKLEAVFEVKLPRDKVERARQLRAFESNAVTSV